MFCPILIIEKIVYEYLKNTMINSLKARLGWQVVNNNSLLK